MNLKKSIIVLLGAIFSYCNFVMAGHYGWGTESSILGDTFKPFNYMVPIDPNDLNGDGDLELVAYVPYYIEEDSPGVPKVKFRYDHDGDNWLQNSAIWMNLNPGFVATPEILMTPQETLYVIESAIQIWEQNSALKFYRLNDSEINNSFGYINITHTSENPWNGADTSNSCWYLDAGNDYAGDRGRGPQTISLADWCYMPHEIAHEIGHALGLVHEHQRVDRDEYVTRNYVPDGQSVNYYTVETSGGLLQSREFGPYDFYSLMHYEAVAPSRTDYPLSLNSTLPEGVQYPKTTINNTSLSAGDVDTIHALYGFTKYIQNGNGKCIQVDPVHYDYDPRQDVANGIDVNINVSVDNCEYGRVSQQWIIAESGHIISRNGMCLSMDPTDYDNNLGTVSVDLEPCLHSDNFKWDLLIGKIKTAQNNCLKANSDNSLSAVTCGTGGSFWWNTLDNQ